MGHMWSNTCPSDDEFDFDKGWWWFGVSLCSICVLIVICDFSFNSTSRGNPSRLMLARAIFDYLSVITVMYAIATDKINECSTDHEHDPSNSICKFWGAAFSFTLYVPMVYYSSICFQLFLTLKNPFRTPSSRSAWYHMVVISICCFIVLFIANVGNDGNGQYEYRLEYQICFMKRRTGVNLWNVFVIYLPVFFVVIGGIAATYWSIRQLNRRIIDDTFQLRWIVIKEQTSIITMYTINYAIQGGLWIIFQNLGTEYGPNMPEPYLLSVFCITAVIFDCATWLLRNYVQNRYKEQDFKRMEKDENKKTAKKKKIQNLSDALRKEVITFITAGLSHSVMINSEKNIKKGRRKRSSIDIIKQSMRSMDVGGRTDNAADNDDDGDGDDVAKSFGVKIGNFAKLLFNPQISDNYFLMSDDDDNNVDDMKVDINDNDDDDDKNQDNVQLSAVQQPIYGSTVDNNNEDGSINKTTSNIHSKYNQYQFDDILSDRWYPKKIDGKECEHLIETIPIGSVGAENSNVYFTDYAPIIFGYLRRKVYGVSDASYKKSILPIDDVSKHSLELIAKFSEGRSGAFFFFTKDMKYLIKTLTKDEAQLLLNTLKSYVNHMSNNTDTYLSRYLGLHSIKLYSHDIYFVVNKNVFPSNYKSPDETYDIKGSWVDRHTNHHVTDRKLMKDEDLHSTLLLPQRQSAAIYNQMEKDTQFLASVNIMDYSLLLGVYYTKIYKKNRYQSIIHLDRNQLLEEMKLDDDNSATSSSASGPATPSHSSALINADEYDIYDAVYIEGPGRYCIGIIDMLQKWDWNKKGERIIKAYLRRKDKNGISCVEPNVYRKRFLHKLREIGIGSNDDDVVDQMDKFEM